MIRHTAAKRTFKITRVDHAFERACHGWFAFGFGKERKKSLLWLKSFCGAIDNLPVSQVAAPAQRHAARADATQRHGDAPQMLLVVAGKGGPSGCWFFCVLLAH